jgi:hypothetical protein
MLFNKIEYLFGSLSIGLVGVVESDLQLVDVRLNLLLDPQSLLLGLSFSLQRCLLRVTTFFVK